MTDLLEVLAEDWNRALAVVAHPDDMEYGAASAVARWTDQGKHVAYLLVTRGEAGIASIPPAEAGPAREQEQRRSCAAVGVHVVEFLDRPDGLVVADLSLRKDLAAAIRRHQPEVVLSINYRDNWGAQSLNHADHRNVGVALLDAVRDAANGWLFTDAGPAWKGVRFAAFNASPQSSHGVDVSDHLERGIESLRCHELYLANLGSEPTDPGELLRSSAASTGPRLGVQYAAAFEVVGF
jgi:LmbE family N-acetylglucosaminyl deacetylase